MAASNPAAHFAFGDQMNQLRIGERLTVRHRPEDPTRMRVVSVASLRLAELVTAALAIAFGASGVFLLRQAKKVSLPPRRWNRPATEASLLGPSLLIHRTQSRHPFFSM